MPICCSHGIDNTANAIKYGLKTWVADEDRTTCKHCSVRFSFTCRRSHCRSCSEIFCNDCVHKGNVHWKTKQREKQCIRCCKAEKNTIEAVPRIASIVSQSRLKHSIRDSILGWKTKTVNAAETAALLVKAQQLSAERLARAAAKWQSFKRRAVEKQQVSSWIQRYQASKLERLHINIPRQQHGALISNWRYNSVVSNWGRSIQECWREKRTREKNEKMKTSESYQVLFAKLRLKQAYISREIGRRYRR